MKYLLVVAAVFLASVWFSGTANAQYGGDTYVRGHYRSTGRYVSPYYRTMADGSVYNNYSTYPNINPYTGQIGTHHYQRPYIYQWQYNPYDGITYYQWQYIR